MTQSLEKFDGHLATILSQSVLLHDERQIGESLDLMAERITDDLAGKNPIVMPVMQGGLIFAGHLITRLAFPLRINYIHATRYRGETSGGELKWIARPSESLEGQHVLLLDDIFDQGYTLDAIAADCRSQGAASVRSSVLLKKNHPRAVANYRPDYHALEVDDQYVFGFGMDYEHQLRNLNGIYAFVPAAHA